MDTRIPLILDDGAVDFGIESTVIDCTSSIPTLLRPGSITQEMIEAVIGPISTKPSIGVRSPGMKYRHYATNTPITLLTGTVHERQHKYEEYIKNHTHYHSTLISHHLTHAHPRSINLSSRPVLAATKLYSSLIAADKNHSTQILIEGFTETGVGVALMNRLRKAATDVQ
jgi:L-threonylcarbamoyladenylate synthase